jgi:hypothetical protein
MGWTCNIVWTKKQGIQNFVGKFIGGRSLEKPRRRWVGNIKKCLEGIQ